MLRRKSFCYFAKGNEKFFCKDKRVFFAKEVIFICKEKRVVFFVRKGEGLFAQERKGFL